MRTTQSLYLYTYVRTIQTRARHIGFATRSHDRPRTLLNSCLPLQIRIAIAQLTGAIRVSGIRTDIIKHSNCLVDWMARTVRVRHWRNRNRQNDRSTDVSRELFDPRYL